MGDFPLAWAWLFDEWALDPDSYYAWQAALLAERASA